MDPWRLPLLLLLLLLLLLVLLLLLLLLVGQVAQAAMYLATGWTAQVQSRVSEGWRFFFTPSCSDWPWGPLNLL